MAGCEGSVGCALVAGAAWRGVHAGVLATVDVVVVVVVVGSVFGAGGVVVVAVMVVLAERGGRGRKRPAAGYLGGQDVRGAKGVAALVCQGVGVKPEEWTRSQSCQGDSAAVFFFCGDQFGNKLSRCEVQGHHVTRIRL